MCEEDIDVYTTLESHILKDIETKGWSFVDNETIGAVVKYSSQGYIRFREDVLENVTGYHDLARSDDKERDGVFFANARYKLDVAKRSFDENKN